MAEAIYQFGKALDKMLVRPKDRATIGPRGERKSPARPRKPNAGSRRPIGGAIYNRGSDPSMRAVQVETAKRVLDPSKNAGMLRGYRHDEVIAARREAEAEAKEIVEAMADKLKIEDQHAKDALEFAVSVVKNEQVNVKDRLTGAKLVLDFTKARPATKAELEIKKAEDFLDELAKDDPEAA